MILKQKTWLKIVKILHIRQGCTKMFDCVEPVDCIGHFNVGESKNENYSTVNINDSVL